MNNYCDQRAVNENSYISTSSPNSLLDDKMYQLNSQCLKLLYARGLSREGKLEYMDKMIEFSENLLHPSDNISTDNAYNSVNKIISIGYNGNVISFPGIDIYEPGPFSEQIGGEDMANESLWPTKAEVAHFAGTYDASFLPKVGISTLFAMFFAAFEISADYIIAPFLFFTIGDLIFGAVADYFNSEKTYKVFKHLILYLALFFGLTWVIVFEMLIVQYKIVQFEVIIAIFESHALLIACLTAFSIMSLNSIAKSASRVGINIKKFLPKSDK